MTTGQSSSIRVGERVTFRLGRHAMSGVVIEDRGSIGARGRRLIRIQLDTEPGDAQVIEMPADEIAREEPQAGQSLGRHEIINYLTRGGLVAILQANMAGGTNQPRVWLCRNSLGNVTHTFIPERGVVGGRPIPFFALHGDDTIFKPKADEVVEFLTSFGLNKSDAIQVVKRVGTAP